MEIQQEFIDQSILRLAENTPRIERCLAMLSEAEVWQKPNKNLNSVGNLIIHLCGNITQYIISSLGGNIDKRNRDLEFSIQGGLNKGELLHKLATIVSAASQTIENIDHRKLTKIHSVQGFELTGIGIIIHVVEHYSYHTGQITFYTKLLKNKDLGFYADLDLNTKNETD